MCEVAHICKQRTLSGSKMVEEPKTEETVSTMKPTEARPEPKDKETTAGQEEKPATSKKKTTKKQDKPEVNYDASMPDFKAMTIESLINLSKERGLNPSDFDKYTAVNIKRMRITMALKKTYELK